MPLNVDLGNPGAAVLGRSGLLVAATFLGLAALQTAAAMRVLARTGTFRRHHRRPCVAPGG